MRSKTIYQDDHSEREWWHDAHVALCNGIEEQLGWCDRHEMKRYTKWIIENHEKMVERREQEKLRSTLEYMRANPLPTRKNVSVRNQGWNEAIDFLLSRLQSLCS